MTGNSEPKCPAAMARRSPCPAEIGFSLLELLVAMAVFVVVGGAAFTLFLRQQPFAAQQQNQVGLSIGLRNAMTQLQNDLVNAGTGQFAGANIPSWPVGVAIINNVPGGDCYNAATHAYSASCFDSISVVAANLAVPPIHADSDAGGCTATNQTTTTGDPASGLTAAQTAANYNQGDQLLLLAGNGKLFTTVVLTQAAQVSGSYVQFTHNATDGFGINTAANDPLGISTGTDANGANKKLTSSFCNADWIIKLAPITYAVNAGNPADPLLTRSQNGQTATVMEQVIGFKVGATIWNNGTNPNDSITTKYIYDASTYNVSNLSPPPYDSAYNFTLVRSIRISLIGRTTPSTEPNYTFRNTFDQGPYQIQGVGIVVNPRNMSMRD
ncbi:MAG TPA: prepilin-type N-terminal cleavage/methylation domain-containing protein [Terriglobia bacterium]|nr:prepilin-type N-terminal cleavage/methylation domain-containing protein [Terriglobia bacterium]